MMPPEFLEQRREHVETDGHAADEPQRPGELLLGVEDALRGVANVGEHAVTQLEERFSRWSDLNPSSEPDEKRFLELLLEQQDLPADGRLRHVQPRAGG